MRESIKFIIIAVICIVILALPLPADDLYVRFHAREAVSGDFRMYYATDAAGAFDSEQFSEGTVNGAGNEITFKLDPALEGKITNIRFDLPPASGLVVLDSVSASSGGFIKKRWSVADIFAGSNLVYVNGAEVQTVPSRELVYISTTENDPYVIFTPNIVSEISGNFSHKLGTRIIICMFIALGTFFSKLDLFKAGENGEGTVGNKG